MSEVNSLVIRSILSQILKEDLFIFSCKGHLESAKAHHNNLIILMFDLFFVNLVFLTLGVLAGWLRHLKYFSIQVK